MWQLLQSMNQHMLWRKFKHSSLGNAINKCYKIVLAAKRRKHPTQAMLQSIKFYQENKAKVESVIDLLEDEESRRHYKQIIDFRSNSDTRDFNIDIDTRQYFGHDFFTYTKDEVFVDCGAYVGDTIDNFLQIIKEKSASIKKIVAFEPDPQNFQRLVSQHPDCVAKQLGVSNMNGSQYFNLCNAGTTSLSEITRLPDYQIKDKKLNERYNYTEVTVCAIDDIEECHDMTFLKMDIEGSELLALQGAKQTILNNRPKLAICIYHSDNDMIEIPLFIHQLVPEYKLWVRAHVPYSAAETVLYASI